MKILIVDDEILVRRSLGRVLRAQKHDVIEAEDGQIGLEQWRAADPDLVFLDVLMPGLSGPQVLEEIGPQRRAKVVLMSAYSGEYRASENPMIRADLFLPKPFDDIFEVIRQAQQLL